MTDVPEGCATPSTGPILELETVPEAQIKPTKEKIMEQARVGKPAPDFELTAFEDNGFKNIRLSDYKGK